MTDATKQSTRDSAASNSKVRDAPVKKPLTFGGPQSFVTIHTGVEPNKQTFMVMRNVLVHFSPFFETALNSSFVEAATQVFDFEDLEADVVALLVNGLYTQKIVAVDGNKLNVLQVSKLWTLAGRWMIPELQRASAKALWKCKISWTNNLKDHQELVEYSYSTHAEQTPAKDMLLFFIIGQMFLCQDGQKGMFMARMRELLSPSLATDLTMAFLDVFWAKRKEMLRVVDEIGARIPK